MADVPNKIANSIHRVLKCMVPDLTVGKSLTEDLVRCAEKTGQKFIFIIDEWDALIREAKNNPEAPSRQSRILRNIPS